MDKQSLRKLNLEKRKSLSAEAVKALSESITLQFSSLALDGISFIHLFYPIPGKHEVDSLQIAGWLRRTHPHLKLVLSRSDLQNHSLHHILWEPGTELIQNKWGITEPVAGEEVKPEKLDMIIIPLLAYDVKGNRVGYGKGFYDRFLAECRKDALKVGLSFFGPEQEITGTDKHDIPLDLCLTPDTIWRFNDAMI